MGSSDRGERRILVRFLLNRVPTEVWVRPEATLLQCLREYLLFTGTKCGCEIGQCGACTVIYNGRAVASCLVLAAQVEGSTVETVEGLAAPGIAGEEGLHPLQRAFLDADAVACGFCTPGMLMAAKALLDQNPHPTVLEVRRAISGNLCRCTGYWPIVEAIERAGHELAERAAESAPERTGEGFGEEGRGQRAMKRTDRTEQEWRLEPVLSAQEARDEAWRCLQCHHAPCTTACPADIVIPRFIRMIRSGNFMGAAEVVRSANPLAHSCGRPVPTSSSAPPGAPSRGPAVPSGSAACIASSPSWKRPPGRGSPTWLRGGGAAWP